MADVRVRSIERSALSDPEAQLRLVRERVRCGELDPRVFDLAMYLSSPALQAVTPCLDLPRTVEDLYQWVLGLEPWGEEVMVQAALASARCVLPHWAERYPGDTRLEEALAAVEVLCGEHSAEVRDSARRLHVRLDQMEFRYTPSARAVVYALEAALRTPFGDFRPWSFRLSLPHGELQPLVADLTKAGADVRLREDRYSPDFFLEVHSLGRGGQVVLARLRVVPCVLPADIDRLLPSCAIAAANSATYAACRSQARTTVEDVVEAIRGEILGRF